MGLFKRSKQFNLVKMITNQMPLFSNFGNNIYASDIVKMSVDRIATQCAKLKPLHIKKDHKTGIITPAKGHLNRLLSLKPNPIMTTYDFIYKTVTLLYMNNNVFLYPKIGPTGEIEYIMPLNPNIAEFSEDLGGSLFVKFYFADGQEFTLPYENIIHLRKFYGTHDLFGGSGYANDHKEVLKTVSVNDNLLQGLDNAMKTSMQIKGLLKMNAMLNEKDKTAQRDLFDTALLETLNKKGSAIIPVDLKSEYIPIEVDPKLIDKDTLDFIQNKIFYYFGVSIPIINGNFNEDEFNSFYENTIEPLAIALSQAFTSSLFTDTELQKGNEIMFYSERLQYASWETKVNAIEKLMGLGILSLNESRSLLGLTPVEDGDKRLQSLNYVDADGANQYQGVKKIKPKEEVPNEEGN